MEAVKATPPKNAMMHFSDAFCLQTPFHAHGICFLVNSLEI
jgi:hypothetical protein